MKAITRRQFGEIVAKSSAALAAGASGPWTSATNAEALATPVAATPTSRANDLINVPKGGGALKGIGEKFSPDLFTGTGNFTIPIEIPPGRNGFQPQVSLVYSTGHGNSPFGLGWSLTVP